MAASFQDLTSFDAPGRQAQRLRQFLKFNIPVNVVISASMFLIWAFFPFWTVPIIGGLVAGYAIELWYARVLVLRRQLEAAVFHIAGGAMVLTIAGMYLGGGLVLPILAVLALWPVMLALPYVSARSLLILACMSTASGIALAVLSFAGDLVGISRVVPFWIPMLANAICLPTFIGFMCQMVWHYSSRLSDTLVQLRMANGALVESERSLERKVDERTRELARKTEELLKLDQMKTQFVSNASHELRSPLTSIRAFSELLADDPSLTDEQSEFARTINLESERLSRLATRLLDLSRMEAGVVEWHFMPLDLLGEIRNLAEAQRPVASVKGLELRINLPLDLPFVRADRDALRQVLLNLTNNAIKFTDTGWVEISAIPDERHVQVVIEDTGPGISPADQERVFERFYQAGDPLTDKPAGAGLGLAICREILAHHDSELRLFSTLGEGSRFSFVLPAMDRPRVRAGTTTPLERERTPLR
ncbi:MAG: HAMP domain-containing histidine kinase [Chloroflexi bacterium]|nr:HAMP domain-containing histidine kinase [Chloroflexota bacterium]